MNPERWARIEAIYHEAEARPAGERAGYLRDACAGDEALRKEVESLLRHDAGDSSFLEVPAAVVAAGRGEAGGPTPTTAIRPDAVGSYLLLQHLGRGTHGEVFRARDTTLGREVAIRILPPPFAADPERLWRFEREMRTLASVRHPHIVRIQGIKVLENGATAVIQELVAGETLSARLAYAPLPVATAVPLARGVATALEAAHARGVVHGNIRPTNIKLSGSRVKLLDFGFANGADWGRPQASGGAAGGAAWCASPEQLRGDAIDARSDMWSFGCVLYEMLTGHRRFDESSHQGALHPQGLPAATPPQVRELLEHCTDEDVTRRPRGWADVVRLLDDSMQA